MSSTPAFDVAILAGGRGSRLAGIWDGPKCLVPVEGRPILGHLLDLILPLHPRRIALLLGHRAPEVLRWYYDHYHRDLVRLGCEVISLVETEPRGTAVALRSALPCLTPVVLVLNGDTLPTRQTQDIQLILYNAQNQKAFWGGNLVSPDEHGVHAGAVAFNEWACEEIARQRSETDIDYFIYHPSCLHFPVPEFLDVGTPDGFHEAQRLSDAEDV